MTIQRLLVDPQEQANLRHRVLIVDEAGMVSARQMTALLELAEQHPAQPVRPAGYVTERTVTETVLESTTAWSAGPRVNDHSRKPGFVTESPRLRR
jgi:AAA domain-containing protein